MEKSEMSTAYQPKEVEGKWLEAWLKSGIFKADEDPTKKPFSMVLPPPNVTGALHLGHAVNGTIQDVLARSHRMMGFGVLWQPGTDHAGIATQNVVEKKLLRERKMTRHQVGREAFIKEVWAWKEEYGNTIIGQLKRLGASMDYDRWRFTMDEEYTKAIRTAFVHLFEKGIIYRGNRIINWCPRCLTSLSDLEVVYQESDSSLYYIHYPTEDGNEGLVVATVRPETMFGDAAVAVHPEDERYVDLIGKNLRLPLTNRLIPVIADPYVEREFGTGALKITPAHDPNDFEIGARHSLAPIDILNNDGSLNEKAGKYAGMDRFEARKKVVEDLEKEGFLKKVEAYHNSVGFCQRCDTAVEPRLSEQWFVSMKELAQPAIQVVEEGKINFSPERWSGVYLDWLKNIRDWCISRQLWWGHRIPVWYCPCGEKISALEDPTECPKCGSRELVQDPDVLDTWFSSALWPFATLGWPDETPEMKYYYPTDVLSTARDIMHLWVARMVFSSLEYTGEIPFKNVVIHATILDAKGQRMSKSKGTGIDPLVLMDKYGTDACRFWMAGAGTSSQDVRFTEDKLESSRNFTNKLWNASRFVLMKISEETGEETVGEGELVDTWILSRLENTVKRVTEAIDSFTLIEATNALYEFVWNEFCDWYLELAKPRLIAGDKKVQGILKEVLSTTLKLLHPFMPFITEEIDAQLIERNLVEEVDTLQKTSWPQVREDRIDPAAEASMSQVMEVIRVVRNIRSELNVPPAKKAEKLVIQATNQSFETLFACRSYIAALAKVEEVNVVATEEQVVKQAASGMAGENKIFLPLAGMLDLNKEIERLGKEKANLAGESKRLEGQLQNEQFVSKAPVAVVDKLKARQKEVENQLTAVSAQIESLK